MNNIRWTVTFKTIKEKNAIVYIGDRNFSGTPIALEPALDTLTLDAVSEKLTDAVRTETGYLRVIDNGDLADLMPVGAMDRPVELHIDGELCWRGYITPATYTSGWEVTPKIQEIPLQSAFSVLSTKTIEESAQTKRTIASYLQECLLATGYTYQSVFLPIQMTQLKGRDWPSAELCLSVSLYNFLTPANPDTLDPEYKPYEGKSYLDVLSAICQFFGWQAVEYADSLVLLSSRSDVTSYRILSKDDLQVLSEVDNYLVNGYTINIPVESEYQLTYDGISHSYSVIPGYRKVSLTANANIVEDISPSIDASGKIIWADTNKSATDAVYARNMVVKAPHNIELYKWAKSSGTFVEQPYQYPTNRDDFAAAYTAQIVLNDTIARGEDNIPINYNYTAYLRLRHSGSGEDIVRLAKITSLEGGIFPKGGALCLSLNGRSSYNKFGEITDIPDRAGISAWGPCNCNLMLSVCVGDKWWTGGDWISLSDGEDAPIFQHYVGTDNYNWSNAASATGTLENDKTIDDPYNGAEGMLMEINETLSGKVSIIFYGYSYDGISNKPSFIPGAIFISNINVGYYSDRFNRNTQPYSLYSLTGKDYRSTLDLNLSLSSLNDRKPGRGTLYHTDEPISADNIPGYNGENLLPEEYLMRGLTAMTGSPSRRLSLEVEWNSIPPYHRVEIDGITYSIAGMQTDIHHESTTLILASYGED